MQFRKFFFVLSTSSTIVLSGPSSSAFTLTQSPGRLESKFELANGTGTTSLIALDPDQPFNLSKSNPFVSEIKRGGTDTFLTTLSTTYNKATGWSFKKGKDLKGSFNVRLQYPCGIDTDCGLGLINPPPKGTSKQDPTTKVLGGIGSTISLNYVPLKGSKRQPDPKNSQNLYWIQRITTNYPYLVGSVGNTISYIDNININNGRNRFTPYYGFGNSILPNGLFEDRHYRPSNVINLLRDYFWTAELYLAQSNPKNVQEVTIYNGVKWGWNYPEKPRIAKSGFRLLSVCQLINQGNQRHSYELRQKTVSIETF
ncbi:MAG: hypothetical protein P2A85_15880 [Microcoleus anatoxicus]|uniref:hypothetical protein n=1 Tax=Microcoleus anatoxicus TaxID=2705319 RepID=UPI00366D9E4B